MTSKALTSITRVSGRAPPFFKRYFAFDNKQTFQNGNIKEATRGSNADFVDRNYNAAINPEGLGENPAFSAGDEAKASQGQSTHGSSNPNKSYNEKGPNKTSTSGDNINDVHAKNPIFNDQNTPGRSGTNRGSPNKQPTTGF